MKKIIFLLVLLLVLMLALFVCLVSINSNITGSAILSYKTLTKAICNETNYCQDYIISCNGNQTISKIPISGAAIQHPDDWKDKRNKTETDNLCG